MHKRLKETFCLIIEKNVFQNIIIINSFDENHSLVVTINEICYAGQPKYRRFFF